jgi:hypothetical protein
MKTLTVRLPDPLVVQIEAESRARRVSKSDVVRERLSAKSTGRPSGAEVLDSIADLIGSVEDLPADLSANTKRYLRSTGYGRKRSR